MKRCPFCFQKDWRVPPTDAEPKTAECRRCGPFAITDEALAAIDRARDIASTRFYRISALIRSAPSTFTVTLDLVQRLERDEIPERMVNEKIEMFLRWLAARTLFVGHFVSSNPDVHYPVAACRSPEEWGNLRSLIENELHLIDHSGNQINELKLTHKGWEWIAQKPRAASSKAFIAMHFDQTLDAVYRAIAAGVEAAGYESVRMDKDLDVQHLNFITWLDDRLDNLTDRVKNHIQAQFGRGPRA